MLFCQPFYLHPTMYLLIRLLDTKEPLPTITFTSHYVSINSILTPAITVSGMAFTSHYVSINSLCQPVSDCIVKHLHPTMYLLIQI